ncbi:RDD family protein [Actinoallomurus rhizosphaericola]|uniref:RDD family protein n=1 Tax=Actinoallomurus rhizosphaericola TaxID=2952536 RepID=UPI002091A55A|nr:RDD family protein [Actinoallomurus rhizosphaericola]MCO5994421.1 RDD family protein [Actinoallomurus rhizosphaericola]
MSEAYPSYGDQGGYGGQSAYGRQDGGGQDGYGGQGAYDDGGAYGGQEPPAELLLAPIARRAAARLIDAGLLGVVGFALILPFMIAAVGLNEPGSHVKNGGGIWSGTAIVGWILVLGILPFGYEAVQLALWGQTLGKRVLRLRVVGETGEPLTPARASARAAVNNVIYLFGCGVGTVMAYLWAIWDQPLHQGLHDRLAATVVVDDREFADE